VTDLRSPNLAEQKGTKIITKYEVKIEKKKNNVQSDEKSNITTDNFYELMLSSCKDAVKIQNELGGMMDAKSIAVTLFIKINQNGYT
jgi:hypothetical protein